MLTSMLATCFLAPALAVSVDGGVQAALYAPGLALVGGLVAGVEIEVGPVDLEGSHGDCDRVGVRDFNATVPIRSLSLEPQAASLAVTMELGVIRGSNMELYTEDDDTWDTCFNSTWEVDWFTLNNGVARFDMVVEVVGGLPRLSLDGTMDLEGELRTDVDGLPDDLLNWMLGDLMLDMLAEVVGELGPGVLNDALAAPIGSGNFGDYSFAPTLVDADHGPEGLGIGADVEIAWTGDRNCLPEGSAASSGRRAQLDLDDADGSGGAIGMDEAQLNQAFADLWGDGFLCYGEGELSQVISGLQSAFDPSVGGLDGSMDMGQAPVVILGPEGAQVSIDGLHITITGELDGQPVTLLELSGGVEGTLALGLDAALTSFTLSPRDVSIRVDALDTTHLSSETGAAEEHIADFLEGWVSSFVAARMDGMVIFPSLYHQWSHVLRVDKLRHEEAGIALFFSVFHEGDPEVDHQAPQTSVAVAPGAEGQVIATFAATDDREGELVYAWALDGKAWSVWSLETTAMIPVDDLEVHTLRVLARDSWWNVDPSPAEVDFRFGEGDLAPKACGCGVAGATPGPWAWLCMGLFLGWRRR